MADQLDDIKKAGKIRVAIAMGTPLFSYADANFSPRIGCGHGRALAKDLGVKLELVQITNAAVCRLAAKRADLVIADLSITPERRRLDFSIPYALSRSSWAVQKIRRSRTMMT